MTISSAPTKRLVGAQRRAVLALVCGIAVTMALLALLISPSVKPARHVNPLPIVLDEPVELHRAR